LATVHFRQAYTWINNVDLSDDVESVTLNFGSELLDETAMGDDTRINKGGLKTWSVDLNFHQDFASSQVDATLFTLVGTTTCFELRPLNSCTTTINPSFTGIGIIESYNPVGGSVGSLLDAPVTIQSAGSISRSVAAT
jgi:hypothetical protein